MPAKPNEILITRVYDAPVKLVWAAWTDLNLVAQWWGPRGFTITTKSKELRPGGQWIYTMHGPDGVDYPNITTYHEVVPFKKLVYDHGATPQQDKLFSVSVTFEENKGKTTMSMTMALPTAEAAKATKQFIKNANGNSTWDRLAEHLEKTTAGTDIFVINRSFEADIRSVFRMWQDPELYSKWMGPKGSTMTFLATDVREGGASRWSMISEDGDVKFGQLNYVKIESPSLFVYTQNFCDKDGNPAKAPFSVNYPEKFLTTVTLAEESENQTRVTVRWEMASEATAVERQTFLDMKLMMTGGWNGSFDKLDSLLLG